MFDLFFKNKKKYSMNTSKIKALHGRSLKYACERDSENCIETRLGGEGAINVKGGEFFVVCGGKNAIRCDVKKVKCAELMDLSGVVISGFDKDQMRPRRITAYFSDRTVSAARGKR